MKKKQKDKESRTARLLLAIGILSFILAAVLVAIMIVMNIPKVRVKYDEYLVVFENLEKQVASLNNKWLILIVILLLFLLRANSWIYPLTIVYFISAMVFTPMHSFIINFGSTMFLCAFRYYTGMQMGEGVWNKILKKDEVINGLFRQRGKKSPLTLFALRLIPFFPFNTVSHIYGTFDFNFAEYMLISAVALAPRLISYSFIGNNVYDPLSTKFYIPLAFTFVLTGISMFTLRGVLGFLPRVFRKKENKANEQS